jgi:hypothetical protein
MGKTKKRLPCPDKNKPWHKHLPEDIPDDPIESNLKWTDCDRHSALYEAYKKHSAELRAIEDGENKSLLLILTIFGAGATAVSKVDLTKHPATAAYLIALVIIITVAGFHVVHENKDLRTAVRELLVRCEQAMGFYTPNAFLKGHTLYQLAERHYACKGRGLQYLSWFVILAAGVGLILLIWHDVQWGLRC